MSHLAENILSAARAMPEGGLLSPKEFLHLGSRAAIDKTLSRLAQEGKLLRVSRGAYVAPHQGRFGSRPPSTESVVQAIEASSARGLQAQLRALALCTAEAATDEVADRPWVGGRESDRQEGPGHGAEAGLRGGDGLGPEADLEGTVQPGRQGNPQDVGGVVEALAARLPPGNAAEWVIALPLAPRHLHRLGQLTRSHEGLLLYLVGDDAPPGPRPERAQWLRPSRLAEDWQAGGAPWP